LSKFGYSDNSFGSLEILDSIGLGLFEYDDPENHTIRTKKFSISCAVLKSVQFWLIFVHFFAVASLVE